MPAALVNERSCIAQVAVSPANVRTAEPPRAGGVIPRGMRASSFGKKRSVLPVRYSNHGGLTPAALVNECSCSAQVAVSPANVRTAEPPRAGGVSPPWHASILIRQETLGVAGAIPNHGGLTPAALVHVRLCSANGAIPRWNVTSCTKSGRRKPTVANVTHPPVGNAYQQRHPFTRPGVSGVSQLCDASFPFGETRSPLPV
jgi:hypothetical protein